MESFRPKTSVGKPIGDTQFADLPRVLSVVASHVQLVRALDCIIYCLVDYGSGLRVSTLSLSGVKIREML